MSHKSYLIAPFLQDYYYLSDVFISLTFPSKPRKCCQWTEMRHLPSISSDFRQLRGLTGHTRHRKTNKKRNTGSVSQSLSFSISFNRWIFIKLRSVKGREGTVGTSQPSQQTILKGNQELDRCISFSH